MTGVCNKGAQRKRQLTLRCIYLFSFGGTCKELFYLRRRMVWLSYDGGLVDSPHSRMEWPMGIREPRRRSGIGLEQRIHCDARSSDSLSPRVPAGVDPKMVGGELLSRAAGNWAREKVSAPNLTAAAGSSEGAGGTWSAGRRRAAARRLAEQRRALAVARRSWPEEVRCCRFLSSAAASCRLLLARPRQFS